MIQHLTHFCLERVQGKGLLEERDARIQRAVVADCVFRVPRHVQHFHVRSYFRNALRKFSPVHSRHDHVREHQVNRSLVRHTDLHGRRAIRGFHHRVTLLIQELTGQAAEIDFVFHHQNSFPSSCQCACIRHLCAV